MLAKAVMDQKYQWNDTTVFACNTNESSRKAVLPIQINLDSSFDINNRYMKLLHVIYNVTSDKNILYARRLVVYRNQRRWWCKKQGNKASD